MTSGNQWREQKRLRRDLTALNLATSARYAVCVTNGGHRASGERVVRQFPGKLLDLPICEDCGVPFGGPMPKRWGEQPI